MISDTIKSKQSQKENQNLDSLTNNANYLSTELGFSSCFQQFLQHQNNLRNKRFSEIMEELLKQDLRKKEGVWITDHNTFQSISQAATLSQIKTLKIITYNVWFQSHNFNERSIELIKLFLKYSPDFICLQEVTQPFIENLSQNSELCKTYCFSSKKVKGYDLLILSKHECIFTARLFPSNMGRNLLYGTLNINESSFVIGTTHLESLDNNYEYRKCQLSAIAGQLSDSKEAIFMGDLNLSRPKEETYIPKEFQDVWVALKNNDPGYTMPASSQYSAIRFDRVLLRQPSSWIPSKIEIIGQDPLPLYQNKIPVKDEVTTPSDHYGLYIELSFNEEKK